MTRKHFLTLAFAALLFAVSRPIAGCGGDRASPPRDAPPLPAAFSRDEHRPNYGGDLRAVYYWSQGEVTYRFPPPELATTIRLVPRTDTIPANAEQIAAVREGFDKLTAELGGRVTFRQIDPDDRRANVDVLVSRAADLDNGNGGNRRDPTGRTAIAYDTATDSLIRATMTLTHEQRGRPLRLTVLHEVGHTAGVWGHSNTVLDRMYSTAPPSGLIPLIEYTERDGNTFRALYADRPVTRSRVREHSQTKVGYAEIIE